MDCKGGRESRAGLTSVIPATGEVKIRRIEVEGQSRQKAHKIPISTNKS
jgi:hypothetical protein